MTAAKTSESDPGPFDPWIRRLWNRCRQIRLHDPDHEALRKAVRVALIMSAMAFIGQKLVADENFAVFAAFGSFALLAFADFAGPLRTRFLLGLGFAVTGAALVAAGTAVSQNVVASALMVLVVGFVLTFSGVIGGYAASGGNALILATVLSLMLPAGAEDIPARVIGWLTAGAVGSVAMVVLWPARPRPKIRLALSGLAREVSALLTTLGATRDTGAATGDVAVDGGPVDASKIDAAAAKVHTLRSQVDASLSRPGGPRSRDQALLYLIDEMDRAVAFVRRIPSDPSEQLALSREDAESLRASGRLLAAVADLLADDRTAHRRKAQQGKPHGGETKHSKPKADGADSLDQLTSELARLRKAEIESATRLLDHPESGDRTGSTDPNGQLLERMDVLFPVRMLSYLALSIASNSLIAVGRDPGDTSFEIAVTSPALHRSRRDTLRIGLHTLGAHLRPRSRWFRNAVRVGVALAASVAVADALHPDNAFWIVLGTLSVLRSSVMDTGASAIQAIIGTSIGFGLGAGIMAAVGDHTTVLWVLLPIVIFIPAYLSAALSYMAGQVGFTVMVVVLFNISDPIGWELGLERVERILLGVALSVVAALVIWPRGATRDLARAVATQYSTALDYSKSGFDHVLGSSGESSSDAGSDHRAQRRAALAAGSVADSELGGVMDSRESGKVPTHTWVRLVTRPRTLLLGGDWLHSVAERQGEPAIEVASATTVTAAARQISSAATTLRAPLEDAAAQLRAAGHHRPHHGDTAGASTDPTKALAAARRSATAMLDDPSSSDQVSARQVFALLWALEWLGYLHDLDVDTESDLHAVLEVAHRPWWR